MHIQKELGSSLVMAVLLCTYETHNHHVAA
ncbi:hypothetical protein BH24DEI1_BH24DEI1_14720 [soil metagenome]